jgi:hypothetical protein
METSETEEQLLVYKFPQSNNSSKSKEDYKLTTFCKIRPSQNKKTCDYLVPTNSHDKTYVYVMSKTPVIN